MTTPAPDPDGPWTDIGAEYVPAERRPEFAALIDTMGWVTPTGAHPAAPALALDQTIEQFGLDNIAAISYDTTWAVPDGPMGTEHYPILGIWTSTLRLVLFDRGFDVRVVHAANMAPSAGLLTRAAPTQPPAS